MLCLFSSFGMVVSQFVEHVHGFCSAGQLIYKCVLIISTYNHKQAHTCMFNVPSKKSIDEVSLHFFQSLQFYL